MSCAEVVKFLLDGSLTLATIALAVLTFWLVLETKSAAKKQLGVNTWLHFIKRWDSDEIRETRKDLARKVAVYRRFGGAIELGPSADTILDFFEEVGTVYRLQCLDPELAYSSLSYDAENWWVLLASYVKEIRQQYNETAVYQDFERMVNQMRLRYSTEPNIKGEDSDRYLSEEAKL